MSTCQPDMQTILDVTLSGGPFAIGYHSQAVHWYFVASDPGVTLDTQVSSWPQPYLHQLQHLPAPYTHSELHSGLHSAHTLKIGCTVTTPPPAVTLLRLLRRRQPVYIHQTAVQIALTTLNSHHSVLFCKHVRCLSKQIILRTFRSTSILPKCSIR